MQYSAWSVGGLYYEDSVEDGHVAQEMLLPGTCKAFSETHVMRLECGSLVLCKKSDVAYTCNSSVLGNRKIPRASSCSQFLSFSSSEKPCLKAERAIGRGKCLMLTSDPIHAHTQTPR